METQYISLNMTPTGVNPCFHISQYDIGRSLGFIIYNGSEVVDLDSYTCTVEATRSDGVAITASVATDDNIGTFEVTPTMSNKADKYRCQLVIVDENSKRIASLPFDMDVCKAAMDENAESIEEDASLYQQYTEAVQGAIAEANADIQAEENARIAAVNVEATTRANADTALQNNIDAEATARQTADNTLQGNINSEAATRASADSNLQSQINQIIAPSGEAPSAAEVQNARIGADGVTYDTLGNAIRGQVRNLKNALDADDSVLYDILKNNNCIFSWINGEYVNYNTGVFGGLDNRSRTNRVTLSGRKIIVYATGRSDNMGLAFYDENNAYISGVQFMNGYHKYLIDAPVNATQVALSTMTDSINSVLFVYADNLDQITDRLSDVIYTDISDLESVVWTEGRYVNANNGNISGLGPSSASSFIPVSDYDKIELYVRGYNDARGIAFYADNYEFISGVHYLNEWNHYVLDIPATAAYIRASCDTSDLNTERFYLKLYTGTTAIKKITSKATDYYEPDVVWVDGKYWNVASGAYSNFDAASASNMIQVEDFSYVEVVCHNAANDLRGVCFMNCHGTYVGGYKYQPGVSKCLFTIPEGGFIMGVTNPDKTQEISVRLFGKKQKNNQYNFGLLTTFQKIGFVGDSYTKSQIYNKQGVSLGYFEDLGYPRTMARFYNFTPSVFAWGGATTKSWLEESWGLAAALAAEPQQLYVLALGINDRSYVTKGTIEDIKEDYTQNPNTFYGNYGKIIEQLQAHAPSAKFVIVKSFIPYDDLGTISNYYKYSDSPCEEIAEHYGFPYIETVRSDFLHSDAWLQHRWGGHPTAPLYSGLAKTLGELIDGVLADNPEYFGNYLG